MTPADTTRGASGELLEADFARIAAIAQRDYGIHLAPSKKAMLHSRLSKRLRALSLPGYEAYCALLEKGESQEAENFVSAITTNVTSFYREAHHFVQLQNEILPPLVAQARSGRRIRLWSAGCSIGAEPYSLAGSVVRLCPEAGRLDLKILATDLDPQVVARARQGRYTADEADLPPGDWAAQVFEPAPRGAPTRKIRPDVAALVAFRQLNLMAAWPMSGRFDVIMCRNVAIYFDKPTQQALWQRFASVLAPGGMLFIGHSERLSGPAETRFTPAGMTAYRLTG